MLTDERLAEIESKRSLMGVMPRLFTTELIDEIRRLRSVLSSIAEVIPEYASEAWMVQEASDALGVKNDER